MGFIPKGARWYLADVVLEHRVTGDPRNIVHINTHLVEAGSPDEAYEKALALGREGEHSYENTSGQCVDVVFRGLTQLNVIHDPLEDGAELMWSERIGVSEEQLRTWVSPKERLGVFAPIEGRLRGPDLMPDWFPKLTEYVSGTDPADPEVDSQPST